MLRNGFLGLGVMLFSSSSEAAHRFTNIENVYYETKIYGRMGGDL